MALSQLAAETFDFHSTCRRAKSGACRFPFDYCEYSLTKERYTTIAHTYIYTYTGIPYTYRIRPPHESARPRFLARAFLFFVANSFETTLPFSTHVRPHAHPREKPKNQTHQSRASQRHARVRRERKGGNLLLCAGVRSPSAHFTRFMLLFSDEFIFNRAFCFTFLSLSQFSFAHSSSKPLRRRRDGSE